MNKLFSLLALAGVLMTGNAMAQATYIEDVTYQGKHFGIRTNDSLAFFGATPVHRQTGVTLSGIGAATIKSNDLKAAATQVVLTLSKMTTNFVVGVDGTLTNYLAISVVTNVTVSTTWGFATTTAGVATNAVIGAVDGNASMTNIVNALRNLGLAGD